MLGLLPRLAIAALTGSSRHEQRDDRDRPGPPHRRTARRARRAARHRALWSERGRRPRDRAARHRPGARRGRARAERAGGVRPVPRRRRSPRLRGARGRTPHEVVALDRRPRAGSRRSRIPAVTKQDDLLEELAGHGTSRRRGLPPGPLGRGHGPLPRAGSRTACWSRADRTITARTATAPWRLGDVTLPAREFDRLCTKRRTTGGAHASSPQTRPVGRDR